MVKKNESEDLEHFNISDEARERMDAVKNNIVKLKDASEEIILEKPFTSIFVAAAFGAIVAIAVTSYMRERRSFLQSLRDLF